ncbi:AMP-binding enzyme [Halalkalibacillus halophilus]|uniref:AMP-binding enzyme n=1 Tax=Halalkalibacillus halophilus TaxID=392827 RepID=UPI0004075D90|nr:hypothetical protein [Halalkalibacillus halophilus]
MQQYGEEVDSYKVEEFVASIDGVFDAKIVNIPDPVHGEIIIAWVIKEDEALSSEAIFEQLNEKFPDKQIPQAIYFKEEFPMTASGKIQKAKLRDEATNRFNQ